MGFGRRDEVIDGQCCVFAGFAWCDEGITASSVAIWESHGTMCGYWPGIVALLRLFVMMWVYLRCPDFAGLLIELVGDLLAVFGDIGIDIFSLVRSVGYRIVA